MNDSTITDKRFFCVRGFMKSGTNWLGSLLNSHHEISCQGEFHWQNLVAAFNVNEREQPMFQRGELAESFRQHLEQMIRQCLSDAAEPGAKVIGDRTPHSILPVAIRGVPHISIIRDGRDVLVSRAFHLYNHPEVTGLFDRIPEMAISFEAFKKDPQFFHKNPERLLCHEEMVRDSVAWWRRHLESDRDADQRFPGLPVKFVKYEDLHRDTKGERASLFEFLDVDPQLAGKIEGVLKPGFKKERPTEFLRKGAVGDWKNWFTNQSKEWFKAECGDELLINGYADRDDW